jgi:hypothetical protein
MIGSNDLEPPGLRDSAMGPRHLAYVRDPDGNKLCALYRPACLIRPSSAARSSAG